MRGLGKKYSKPTSEGKDKDPEAEAAFWRKLWLIINMLSAFILICVLDLYLNNLKIKIEMNLILLKKVQKVPIGDRLIKTQVGPTVKL